jgi:hypothetical protein
MGAARPLDQGTRRFQVRGHAVEVRCDPPELVEAFARLLRGFSEEGTGARTVYEIRPQRNTEASGFVLQRNGRPVRTARWPDGLVDIVLWEVFHDVLRDELGSVAIHAGAVSYRGRGIVLPAPMNTGKTTLVGALICAGFDYLSDEAALIGMGGRLLPFLKPLTFEPGSYDLLPQLRALSETGSGLRRQHVVCDELRAGSAGTPCEIGWVVTFSRRAGAPTTLEPLTRGEALAALAKNSFNLHRLGARGIETLGSVVRGATALHLEVGDLQDAVQAILGLVGTAGTESYATSQQKTNSM